MRIGLFPDFFWNFFGSREVHGTDDFDFGFGFTEFSKPSASPDRRPTAKAQARSHLTSRGDEHALTQPTVHVVADIED